MKQLFLSDTRNAVDFVSCYGQKDPFCYASIPAVFDQPPLFQATSYHFNGRIASYAYGLHDKLYK